jgi:hypothetical protein
VRAAFYSLADQFGHVLTDGLPFRVGIAQYQTDLTDAEWRVIAPHLPKPCANGRPREWPMRVLKRHLLCRAGGLPVAPAAERLSKGNARDNSTVLHSRLF